jgi:hypothetical protein
MLMLENQIWEYKSVLGYKNPNTDFKYIL